MIVKRGLLFKNLILYYFLLCLGILTLGLGNPVFAEDDEDSEEEFTLEEITVTAEKREAELQKIPMDVSVVRMEDLNELGITKAEDLDQIIPDLEIENMASSFLQVQLRGVKQLLWNPTYETTTAIHMDGVQLTRVNGFNNMLFDMQRVEVLRGPQGTLYGRGSTGGNVNIITQKPILDEFGGNISATLGNYSLYQFEGALNVPISDKIAMRFAGRTVKQDGFSDSNMGNQDSWAGRVSATWVPTDKDTFISTVDFEGAEDNGTRGNYAGYYYEAFGNMTLIDGYTLADDTDTTNTIAYIAEDITTTNKIEMPYKLDWAAPNLEDDEYNYNDNNTWGLMAQWEHMFDFAYLTTVFGYRSLHEDKNFGSGGAYLSGPVATRGFTATATTYWADYSAYPEYYTQKDGTLGRWWAAADWYATALWLTTFGPNSYSHSYNSSHTRSIESRLTSNKSVSSGDKYEWIIGGMWQDDEITAYNDLGAYYWNEFRTVSRAIFGQGSWSPIDKLILSFGGRLVWDKKEYYGNDLDAPSDTTWQIEDFPAFDYEPPISKEYTWNENTYKINVSYFLSDTVMPYLQYSKGYKTGNITNDGDAIDPEFMDSWELGIKSQFFNNRLRVNASGYYYLYENYNQWVTAQWCYLDEDGDHECEDYDDPDTDADDTDYYSEFTPIAPGGAEQMGGNIEVTWLATQKDTISLNGKYQHNEYKDYDISGALIDMYSDTSDGAPDNAYTNNSFKDQTGKEFGGAPIRGNVSWTHREFIGTDMLTATLRAQYEGTGIDIILNANEDDEYSMPGRDDYWVLNFSSSYSSSRWVPEGMRWSASLSITNLFDSEYLSYISYITSDNYYPNSGYITGQYIQPRKITFSLSFNF